MGNPVNGNSNYCIVTVLLYITDQKPAQATDQ